jgi:hypothetical protein
MSDHFLLSKAQMARISLFFPLSHGIPRVDDLRVGSRHRLRHPQWPAVIEIMFGRIKDRRRIATRYDRRAHAFFAHLSDKSGQ